MTNENSNPALRSGICLCAACRTGAGGNSILCIICDDWEHQGSIGVISPLNYETAFPYSASSRNPRMEPRAEDTDLEYKILQCVSNSATWRFEW